VRSLWVGLLLLLAPTAGALDWLQYRGDAAHTGAAQGALLPTQLWWKAATGGPIEGSPVVSDGRVLVGSTDGKLYAFDAVTGDKVWTFDAGGAISGTPAVFGDVVYLVTDAGKLFALQAATGQKRLGAGQGSPDPGPSRAPPTLDQGRLYVPTESGSLFAYSLATLTRDWEYGPTQEQVLNITVTGSGNSTREVRKCVDRFTTAKPLRSSPAVVEGKVLFGSDLHMLFAVDENGLGGSDAGATVGSWPDPDASECKETVAPLTGGVLRASPAIDTLNELVVVASYDDSVRAYHLANGTEAWNYTVARTDAEGRAIDSRVIASPAVSRGKVFFGSYNGVFYALQTNATGAGRTELWNFTAGDAIQGSAVVAGGLVLFGAEDGVLYALNTTTGKLAWQGLTGGSLHGSPAIANGGIYVGSFDGSLYAFGGAKPPLPDLRVANLSAPANATRGRDVIINVSVRNGGGAPSPPTSVRLDLGNATLGNWSLQALQPDEGVELNVTWRAVDGNHTLVSVVDPANLSREYDHANNVARVLLRVTPPPPPPRNVTDNSTANATGNATGNASAPPPSKGLMGIPGMTPFATLAAAAIGGWSLRRRSRG
jgi:eukaryotic-like serine/threonine-protein kinase